MNIMRHLKHLNPESHSDKKLIQRSTGRYFTPHWMAISLASQTLAAVGLSPNIRIVDPFCGDGRLVASYIETLFLNTPNRVNNIEISLWDNCEHNLRSAREIVAQVLKVTGFKGTIRQRLRDSFLESNAELAKYDVVITNPPWETIKPDIRELRAFTKSQRDTFTHALRSYDYSLAAALPYSQPVKKLYGWGTNLSRCGLELSVNLLAPKGICGIVLPSSLFSDQMSVNLRKWLLSQVEFKAINYFPAEAKPFDGVDQGSLVTVFKKSIGKKFSEPLLTKYDRNRKPSWSGKISLNHETLHEVDFRIPTELNLEELQLLNTFASFPAISEWEIANGGKLWMGRELDETNYKSFVTTSGQIPFVKGRDVQRFGRLTTAHDFVIPGARKIPHSSSFSRLAWRDVSRRSQVRRMLATIIPNGVVTGNSLNVGYFSDGDTSKLKALLGIFNSLVFEFQLRSRLGTGHISLGSVRGVRMPDIDDPKLVKRLAILVDQALMLNPTAEVEIEALLADAFSLTKYERSSLINHFSDLPDNLANSMKSKLRIA